MIIIDASEQRSSSTMPEIDGAVRSTILEALTGADVMVSTKRYPPNSEVLIRKHIENGAVLIQIKRGSDLVHSVGPRMNGSLAKMWEMGAVKAWQKVLLPVGIYRPDRNNDCIVGMAMNNADNPYINWTNTGVNHTVVMSAIISWIFGGGTAFPASLVSNDEIVAFIRNLEKKLIEKSKYPTKEILEIPDFPDDLPSEDDPLQLPVRVKDGRRLLAALPGIGIKGANELWKHAQGVLWCAIEIVTGSLIDIENVKGIGKKTLENNREFFGLMPGQVMRAVYRSDDIAEDFSVED